MSPGQYPHLHHPNGPRDHRLHSHSTGTLHCRPPLHPSGRGTPYHYGSLVVAGYWSATLRCSDCAVAEWHLQCTPITYSPESTAHSTV